MKRTLVLLTLAAALLAVPAQAPAATQGAWKGVVVAKDAARGTVAIASANGSVRTIRVAQSRTLQVGNRLNLRGAALADGTVQATSLAVAGRARTTRLKAVVVRHQSAQKRLLVSAGGSTFVLRNARVARASGDRIEATVNVAGGTAQAIEVSSVGRLGVLEVEGVLTKAAPSSIELLVAKAGFVTLTLPNGFALPADIKVFDEVEVHVAVGADGTLSLLAIRGDDDRNRDRVDQDEDEDEVEVKGTITALSESSISVSRGAAATAVTCALRRPLTSFAVGQFVELKCVASTTAGSLVLTRIEHEDEDDDADNDHDDHGDHDNSGPGGGHGGGHGGG